MDVTINQIKCAYRHLYYEDNHPVKVEHLLTSVAKICRERRVVPRLVGLAPSAPEPTA